MKDMENAGIIENNRTQMRRGVLEYSILLILAAGDEYASSIIQKLKDVNIIVAEGTTYPLLIRLKKLGLLSYIPPGTAKEILHDYPDGTRTARRT